jgi:hypothetical protein
LFCFFFCYLIFFLFYPIFKFKDISFYLHSYTYIPLFSKYIIAIKKKKHLSTHNIIKRWYLYLYFYCIVFVFVFVLYCICIVKFYFFLYSHAK